MALDRIDIVMHRPHPPGYLGYVFVARILRYVFPNANTALVVWNWIVTALAALLVALFAFEVADANRQWSTAVAAAAIVLTSPLVWFYGEVAEIYPSELLCAALVGYTAARAARGSSRAMYVAVAALAMTAAFKVVTALLMFPVVAYAWTRMPPTLRWRSFTMLVLATALVAGVFVSIQPDLWMVAQRLAQSPGWLIGLNTDHDNWLRGLNRNLRNTALAAIVSVGSVNIVALAFWAVRDRRLPDGLNRGLAWAWAVPALSFCVVLVVAKPGYLLPFVPLAALVIGTFYARLTPAFRATLIVAQALVNSAHFLWLAPFSPAMTGGAARYDDKSIWQRMASDLQPLTFPTRATIRRSDQRVEELLSFVNESCPSAQSVIVADTAPVDWRRVMFYLPDATAIHAGPSGIDFVGHDTDFHDVPQEGTNVVAPCRIIWLSPDEGPGGVTMPADPSRSKIPHLGWTTSAGTLHVTPTALIQGTP